MNTLVHLELTLTVEQAFALESLIDSLNATNTLSHTQKEALETTLSAINAAINDTPF